MYSGFQSSCIVTDPERLFGHSSPKALLDQLLLQIQIGVNLQLLGEHRSGKTSVLKCCITRLRAENPQLVPVYINFREHYYIRGAAAALRLILAHIHAAIVARGVAGAEETVQLRGASLTASPYIEEHFNALSAIKQDYLVGVILKDYILETLPKLGAGIVLFFDEYEHMMLETFEAQKGAFFPLRDICSQASPQNGAVKPCTCVLAGATPWNRLCSTIGSPELNHITQIYYVEPLSTHDFGRMWSQCVAGSSDVARRSIAESEVDEERAYELSGGWPFFGKAIGDQLCTGNYNEDAMYEAFIQHFEVMWAHLTGSEQSLLIRIARGLPHDEFVPNELIHRGLLRKTQNGAGLVGRLWLRFVRQQPADEVIESSSQATEESLPAKAEQNVFRKEGDYWNIVYSGKGFRLRDTKGLHYIACLLRHPEREFSVLDLNALVAGTPVEQNSNLAKGEFELTTSDLGNAGSSLDRRALKEYQQALNELRNDLEIANQLNNRARAIQLQEEIHAIEHQLVADMGLRGRSRKSADTIERVRKAIYNNYNRSLTSIGENDKELWRHLRNGISSGDFFVYNPEKLPSWQL